MAEDFLDCRIDVAYLLYKEIRQGQHESFIPFALVSHISVQTVLNQVYVMNITSITLGPVE